ncbi:2-hydroxyacid dehydrogenase [Rosenbergiella australiborealis]|uniref:2-hydroxyacid dehydrogenase n=1 Tax=Rosenbergiella australiborealis TaxID=1544696 RepID=UPI001F4E5DAA|nr:glyoxylate/hydroxypyruvate reductase A [Rosenbergiella australiborealis]
MPSIAFYSRHAETDLWLAPLQSALADATLHVWPEYDQTATVAIVWSPDQAFIDAHPHLKVIFNMGAGVDAILALKLPKDIAIIRVKDGGMAVQLAEYCCEAVIRFYREFPEYEQQRQQHQWQNHILKNREYYPVGVMGLGVLGEKIVQALRFFEFPVNGWSHRRKSIQGVTCYQGDELEDFLRASRIIICVLPLTDKTRGILNYQHLSLLQADSYLVNVARGGHLVESDLIQLVEEGKMRGATLDVTQHEPLDQNDPLWQVPQIRITPHIAGKTHIDQVLTQIVPQIIGWLTEQRIEGEIDLHQGY